VEKVRVAKRVAAQLPHSGAMLRRGEVSPDELRVHPRLRVPLRLLHPCREVLLLQPTLLLLPHLLLPLRGDDAEAPAPAPHALEQLEV
jgi:hypothetical protein